MTKTIFYKAGYAYQLASPYSVQTDILLPAAVRDGDYLALETDGMLYIDAGYCWDGPSGPAIDTRDFMRASLVHDALYQLMRGGYIDTSWREVADKIMRTICLEDGMPHFRAQYAYEAVRACAGPAADPSIEHPILQAPVDA